MTASVQVKPKLSDNENMVNNLAKQFGLNDLQIASARKWVDGLNVADPVVRFSVYLLAQKMGKRLAPRPKKKTGPKQATQSAPPAAKQTATPVVAAVVPAEVTPPAAPPKKKGLFSR